MQLGLQFRFLLRKYSFIVYFQIKIIILKFQPPGKCFANYHRVTSTSLSYMSSISRSIFGLKRSLHFRQMIYNPVSQRHSPQVARKWNLSYQIVVATAWIPVKIYHITPLLQSTSNWRNLFSTYNVDMSLLFVSWILFVSWVFKRSSLTIQHKRIY